MLALVLQSFATVIVGTTVASSQLTITGSGFSGTPLKVTFNGQALSVVSSTPTRIVATLSPVPAPGTYRLVVKAGSQSDTFDVAISSAPVIVAQVALTNQTGPILATPLLTPTQGAFYRVSVEVITINGGGTPPYVILWCIRFPYLSPRGT